MTAPMAIAISVEPIGRFEPAGVVEAVLTGSGTEAVVMLLYEADDEPLWDVQD